MSYSASRPSGADAPASSSTTNGASSSRAGGSYVPPHLRRASANVNASATTSNSSSSSRTGMGMGGYDNSIFSKSRSYQPSSRTSAPSSWSSSQAIPISNRSGAPPSWPSRTDPSRDRFRTAPSASRGTWTKYPASSHLFNSGDSFVGAFSPALGPRDDETDPDDREQMEQMRIAKRIRRVVIDKGKGAAAKVCPPSRSHVPIGKIPRADPR